MVEPVLHYNKLRTHKSSKSPRDIQTRQMQRTGSSSDESVLALKEELLKLKSDMLDFKSTPIQTRDGYNGKLYTEDEFNSEVIKALEKELGAGTVGKDSVESKKLASELEESNKKILDLEHIFESRLNELIELKSKVSTLEALLEAKDQTIAVLKDKPIVVNGVAGVVNSEPQYDVPDIEAEVIDPTDSNVKLESFISVAEVKDTSGGNMSADMDKLKDILGGGIKI